MEEREHSNQQRTVQIELLHNVLKELILFPSDARPTIINIGGASASGKSTFAEYLSRNIPGSRFFSMDNYLVGRSRISTLTHTVQSDDTPYLAGLNPASFQPERMVDDICKLKTGHSIIRPIYNKISNEPEGEEEFQPSPFIIVEGLLAFEPEFHRLADISIFVDASTHDRVIRKMIRNKFDYERDDLSWIVDHYLRIEEPTYRLYNPKYKEKADIVVQNRTQPSIYVEKYGFRTNPVLESNRLILYPDDSSGNLNFGERIYLYDARQGVSYFTYEVDGHILLQTELDDMAVSTLGCYYMFDKE